METYGGGIWHSWLDRDLSIAGRVVVSEKSGGFISKLVKIDRPILRIPTLAIHCQFYIPLSLKVELDYSYFLKPVDRSANDSFQFNQQTEFIPILGIIESQLNSPPPATSKSSNASSVQEDHHPELIALLSSELSVSPGEIYDLDL